MVSSSGIIHFSNKTWCVMAAAVVALELAVGYNWYSLHKNIWKIRSLIIVPAQESLDLTKKVWERAMKTQYVSHVVVATDDVKIAKSCRGFGAGVMMTSKPCKNGMERCIEAISKLKEYNVIINVEWDDKLLINYFIIGDVLRTHHTDRDFKGVICIDFKMLAGGGYETEAINVDNSGHSKPFISFPG